jgi:hypothetical protein
MKITLSLFLLISCYSAYSKDYSEYDKKAGLYYIQSKTYPMIFKKCGKLFPELKDAFEIGLEKWDKTNEATVIHGKLLSQADTGLDDNEFEKYMDDYVQSLSKEIKKQSENDLKEGCGEALVYLITES